MADFPPVNFPCLSAISACLILSVVFVLSLYIWQSPHSRDHPSTIKKRFLSVSVMMFLSPLFLYYYSDCDAFEKNTLWELLGLRLPGLFLASTVPLLLTMVLFLGPLALQGRSGIWRLYAEGSIIKGVTYPVKSGVRWPAIMGPSRISVRGPAKVEYSPNSHLGLNFNELNLLAQVSVCTTLRFAAVSCSSLTHESGAISQSHTGSTGGPATRESFAHGVWDSLADYPLNPLRATESPGRNPFG
ncbi:CAAX prenyl protease [Homalodisca vitripennis]|nr:CAAX prenyl protease [Homalodisca vitripennis]